MLPAQFRNLTPNISMQLPFLLIMFKFDAEHLDAITIPLNHV